jgi:hypothetical protein
MLDVEDFSAVFRGLNYSPGLVSEIQEYRTALGGRTYFERLLELLKIKGGMSPSPNPPTQNYPSNTIPQPRPKTIPPTNPTTTLRPAHAYPRRANNPPQQTLSPLLPPQRPLTLLPRTPRTLRLLCKKRTPRQPLLDLH